jgi:hypothetical protein
MNDLPHSVRFSRGSSFGTVIFRSHFDGLVRCAHDEIGFAARQKSFDALNMIFLDRSSLEVLHPELSA